MSKSPVQLTRVMSYWVTLTLVVSPALLIGGTRSDVQLCIGGLALVALLLLLPVRWRSAPQVSWPVWFLTILALFTMVQSIELPMSWIDALSPKAASLYLAYDPGRSWAPLSVAPIQTKQMAILHLTVVATVLLTISHGRRHSTGIAWTIILAGSLCALISYVHMLFGMTQIYGFYEALHRNYMGTFFGPFVNENTMAGLLNLSCLTSAGMLMAAQSNKTKRVAAIAAILCSSAVFLGDSRGGQTSLIIGCLFFGVVSLVVSQEKNSANRQVVRKVLGYGTVLTGTAVVLALFALDRWGGMPLHKLLEEPKFTPIKAIPQLVQDYAWVGSGRGSFSSIYPQYQVSDINGFVTHPENIFAQYLSEWGLIFGSAALVLGIGFLVSTLKTSSRTKQSLKWGIWAGLMSVALQQCVDFGLESMGLAIPSAAALGLLLVSHKSINPSFRHRCFWLGFTAVVGVCLSLWTSSILANQNDKALTNLQQTGLESAAIEANGMLISQNHPADYLVPLTVSRRLSLSVPFDATRFVRWVNHAQRLFPSGGQAHHLAAQTLYANGYKSQAIGEYRRAYQKQPWKRLSLATEITGRYEDAERLLRAIPDTRRAQRVLLETLFREGKFLTVLQIANEQLEWSPDLMTAHVYRSRALYALKRIEALRGEIGWFMDNGHPSHAHILAARIALLENDPERARLHLDEGLIQGGQHKIPFLRQATRCYQQLGDIRSARRMLDHLWQKSRSNTTTAAETLELRGSTETRVGEIDRAIESYSRAFALRPRPALATYLARLEVKKGYTDQAIRRLESGLRKWPGSKLIKNELNGLTQKTKINQKQKRMDQD